MATPEGNRLAALRQLRGLSLDQCASEAGLASGTLEQIERGEGRAADIERLAGLFGLRSAGEEWVEPDDSSKFTVFLLHSATPMFDSADLTVFEEAMRAARVFTPNPRTPSVRRSIADASGPYRRPCPIRGMLRSKAIDSHGRCARSSGIATSRWATCVSSWRATSAYPSWCVGFAPPTSALPQPSMPTALAPLWCSPRMMALACKTHA